MSYDTLKRASPEEELRIIEELKCESRETIIKFLDDVMPNVPRGVNAMDYLSENGFLGKLVDAVSCLKNELRELCSRSKAATGPGVE